MSEFGRAMDACAQRISDSERARSLAAGRDGWEILGTHTGVVNRVAYYQVRTAPDFRIAHEHGSTWELVRRDLYDRARFLATDPHA